MNIKFITMKLNYLKKIAPAVAIFVVVLGVLNFGTYDPYNELTVLTPENAQAVVATGGLTVPTLSSPTLTTPTLSGPTLTTPTLTTPELSTPTLSTPELSTPVLDSPTLSTPTLTTPELSTPTLTTPTLGNPPVLNTPDLSTPTLGNPPALDYPDLGNPPALDYPELGTTTLHTCRVTASSPTIYTGSSVTISWTTQGFTQVTLNGEAVNELSGSKTFTNVQVNTTYVLKGVSDSGSSCTATVKITCLPPVVPKECKLVIEKVVLAFVFFELSSERKVYFAHLIGSNATYQVPEISDLKFQFSED
jgi:hypothetical protein